jgi:hypothetical protein
MEIIVLILTIIYLIWLNRLIRFGIQTAIRIADAAEASAINLHTIVQALPPDRGRS